MNGPNIIDQLAAIRERQGRPPLPDPRVIQGFGPNDEPPPSLLDARLAEATPRPDYEEPDEPEPMHYTPPPVFTKPSPLIPQPAILPASLDAVDLMVVNENAAYKGRSCVMTERERAAIVTVVLQAIRRSIKDQLRELTAMKPRRRKKATVANERKKR